MKDSDIGTVPCPDGIQHTVTHHIVRDLCSGAESHDSAAVRGINVAISNGVVGSLEPDCGTWAGEGIKSAPTVFHGEVLNGD